MKVLKAEFVDKIAPVVDEGSSKKMNITYSEAEERAIASKLWDNMVKNGYIILCREKVESKNKFAYRLIMKIEREKQTRTTPYARGYQDALIAILELILK